MKFKPFTGTCYFDVSFPKPNSSVADNECEDKSEEKDHPLLQRSKYQDGLGLRFKFSRDPKKWVFITSLLYLRLLKTTHRLLITTPIPICTPIRTAPVYVLKNQLEKTTKTQGRKKEKKGKERKGKNEKMTNAALALPRINIRIH